MKFFLGQREVEVTAYDLSGDADEARFQSAYFADTEAAISDQELDRLGNEYASELYEQWNEYQIGRAEAACEGDR